MKENNRDNFNREELRAGEVSLLVFLVLIAFLSVPQNAILRKLLNHSLTDHSPLVDSIVTKISLRFMIPRVFYGIFSGKVIKRMRNSMISIARYTSIVFLPVNYSIF